MTPPVLLRTAYGAEVTVTPEPSRGHSPEHRMHASNDVRRWVLHVDVGFSASLTLSHADLVSLSAQLAAIVEAER